MQKSSNFLYVVKIAAVLLVICGVMAGVLAVVNRYTADVIAENKERTQREEIAKIFGDGCELEDAGVQTAEPVTGASKVVRGTETLGYAVSVTGSGFGGDIEMIVGVRTDGSIAGVRILSMSETPGVGAKVENGEFLDQYNGQAGTMVMGADLDAVSGATISSKAVNAAVNAVLAQFGEEG